MDWESPHRHEKDSERFHQTPNSYMRYNRGGKRGKLSNRLGLARNEGTITVRIEAVFNIKAMAIMGPWVRYLRLNFADSPTTKKMKIAICNSRLTSDKNGAAELKRSISSHSLLLSLQISKSLAMSMLAFSKVLCEHSSFIWKHDCTAPRVVAHLALGYPREKLDLGRKIIETIRGWEQLDEIVSYEELTHG